MPRDDKEYQIEIFKEVMENNEWSMEDDILAVGDSNDKYIFSDGQVKECYDSSYKNLWASFNKAMKEKREEKKNIEKDQE